MRYKFTLYLLYLRTR